MVGADVVTEIVVTGGLPDEEDGGLYLAGNVVLDAPRLADAAGSEGQGQPADVPPSSSQRPGCRKSARRGQP